MQFISMYFHFSFSYLFLHFHKLPRISIFIIVFIAQIINITINASAVRIGDVSIFSAHHMQISWINTMQFNTKSTTQFPVLKSIGNDSIVGPLCLIINRICPRSKLYILFYFDCRNQRTTINSYKTKMGRTNVRPLFGGLLSLLTDMRFSSQQSLRSWLHSLISTNFLLESAVYSRIFFHFVKS